MKLAVVGGGAAGIFGAITAAETNPEAEIVVFEAAAEPLDKVRISGGGRCNVTHHCFDPAELVKNYPRGSKELRGAFHRFQPRDTVAWFESRDVKLKAEPDGRMFPTTDLSSTIIDCLLNELQRLRIELRLNARVKAIEPDSSGTFTIESNPDRQETCNRVLLATGSSPHGYRFAQSLGHTIVPTVPSLFTFKIADPRLDGLSGVSFPDVALKLTVGERTFSQRGPMLITHWGLSGPAVLKLSAWAARELHDSRYKGVLTAKFNPDGDSEALTTLFHQTREKHGRSFASSYSPLPLPRRYWQRLCEIVDLSPETRWNTLPREKCMALRDQIETAMFSVQGKGVFKEEFVTCGGAALREIDFRTMRSKVYPGLYLAGEVLDIDGITGGFNFQSAWTTGHIAGESVGR